MSTKVKKEKASEKLEKVSTPSTASNAKYLRLNFKVSTAKEASRGELEVCRLLARGKRR
jgi:hypothetical protein